MSSQVTRAPPLRGPVYVYRNSAARFSYGAFESPKSETACRSVVAGLPYCVVTHERILGYCQ